MTPADRLRALQRSGYLCQVVSRGRVCAAPAGDVIDTDNGPRAICKHHLTERTRL